MPWPVSLSSEMSCVRRVRSAASDSTRFAVTAMCVTAAACFRRHTNRSARTFQSHTTTAPSARPVARTTYEQSKRRVWSCESCGVQAAGSVTESLIARKTSHSEAAEVQSWWCRHSRLSAAARGAPDGDHRPHPCPLRPHDEAHASAQRLPIARGVGVVTKCMCARPAGTGSKSTNAGTTGKSGGGPLAGESAGGCRAWTETPECGGEVAPSDERHTPIGA